MSSVDSTSPAPVFLRSFDDENGAGWNAGIRERSGLDYKGRFYFVMQPEGADSTGEVALEDVRWNSEDAARRTLLSMSPVELRRRLRNARGRGLRA
jgi:hypothetical protein